METPLKPNDRPDMTTEKLLAEMHDAVYDLRREFYMLRLQTSRLAERLEVLERGG